MSVTRCREWLWVAALLAAGCGAAESNAGASAPTPPAAPVAQKPPDDPRVKCPPGTTQLIDDFESPVPTLQIWCEDADGFRQGPEKIWRKDKGEVWLASEHNYKDGREDGVQRSWHRNGKMSTEATSVGGRRFGTTRTWFPSGRLEYQVEMRDDKPVGPARWWDEQGRLTETRDLVKHPGLGVDDAPSPVAR